MTLRLKNVVIASIFQIALLGMGTAHAAGSSAHSAEALGHSEAAVSHGAAGVAAGGATAVAVPMMSAGSAAVASGAAVGAGGMTTGADAGSQQSTDPILPIEEVANLYLHYVVDLWAHAKAAGDSAFADQGQMSIVLIVLLAAIAMLVVELLVPGRQWKQVAGWWTRAFALNLVQVGAVFLSGVTWDRWFQHLALFNLEEVFGASGAAVFGYLAITFIYYWWHRARHEIPFLWRHFHQVHHSPQRIEIITSFYKHPSEIVANSMLSSAILYVICGLGPEAATLSILLTGLAELFYHWNVNTPYWIGFFFQRPESHCIHHQKCWHRQNYSDLPLWDMMFGTFHNPRKFDTECGFDTARELRLRDMLRGVDVHRPVAGTGDIGA